MYKKEITIGRADQNDIVLEHPTISKFHAKIIFEPNGTLWIEDLNSSNGTFVNGDKVNGKRQLNINDEVKLAKMFFNWQDVLVAEEPMIDEPQSEVKQFVSSTSGSEFSVTKKPKKNWTLVWGVGIALILIGGAYFAYSNGMLGGEAPSKETDENTKDPVWEKKDKNKGIVYSMDCIRDSSATNKTIGILNDIKNGVVDINDVKVSIAEEEKVGTEVKSQMKDRHGFIQGSNYNSRIDAICQKLLRQLKEPKFKYEWYIINDDMINAFTAGGQIFITTGIIDFAISDDELACVIGHEIYHNELGHIKRKLQEYKLAKNILGDELGEVAAVANSILTTSFNQENEVYCDMYGLDLAVSAGYNGCAAIDLWDRMSEKEGETDEFSKIFRSHPYSAERSNCIHHHIEDNYDRSCQGN